MAALSDLSDLINRLTGGSGGYPQTYFLNKNGRVAGAAATTPTAGRATTLWQYDGTYGPGSAPTTGAIPTASTAGAIPLVISGLTVDRWMTGAWASCNQTGTLILYDRLYHIGGLSGTSTSSQTLQGATPSPALTRNTGGVGNFAFWEIYTAVGTTTSTATLTYVNPSNATSTSTATIGTATFNAAQRAQFFPLAAGDTGIKSVTSVQLSASTGTAGNWGVVIGRPLATIGIGIASTSATRDFTTGMGGIPKIDDTACLSLLWLPNAASVPDVFFGMTTVEK